MIDGPGFRSWWQVEDSNLCSFRDGFTVRSHWPLGQPATPPAGHGPKQPEKDSARGRTEGIRPVRLV